MPMNQSAFGRADGTALAKPSPLAGFTSANQPAFPPDIAALAHANWAPRPGAPALPNNKIINAKGVPGTLGCFARTRHDERLVVVSSWHVLFGGGAREGDPVWLVDEPHGARRYERAADAWFGRIGTLRYGGDDFHVDCGIATWLHRCEPSPAAGTVHAVALPPVIARPDAVGPGELVTKTGAATGTTTGVIIDAEFCSVAETDGRAFKTSRQLLIRSIDDGPFSRDGDSGALVVNRRNEGIGLLWGVAPRGEGVACHLAAAFYALDLKFPEARA
jgi:hypothetical protein